MNTFGHASENERALISRLEAGLDLETSPTQVLLELGQLYIEPCHREDDAITLFEEALRRDPRNDLAALWLAYCCIHYLMEHPALTRAKALLESIITRDSELAGAAYLLLAETRQDLGELSKAEKIRLLTASVEKNPDWSFNRSALAWAYREAARLPEAIAEMNRAIANMRDADPEWGATRVNFETSITGRLHPRKHLEAQLEKLAGGR